MKNATTGYDDAVIVATARSPIGRAHKGSLAGIRPDDLAAQVIRAALDKILALDPHSGSHLGRDSHR
jgi:acetyl-CoA C-acetyltransferase